MTVHTAYEVRVYRNADWRIEAVLDDESLAVAAAKKIECRLDKIPVVVVQEIYDAARNHLKSRSVYRSEPAVRPAMVSEAPKPVRRKPTRRPAEDAMQRELRPARPGGAKAEGAGSHVSWALFGVLLASIATYVALKTFTA